jgi:hypothetical protein
VVENRVEEGIAGTLDLHEELPENQWMWMPEERQQKEAADSRLAWRV